MPPFAYQLTCDPAGLSPASDLFFTTKQDQEELGELELSRFRATPGLGSGASEGP
jgi:hypothetical protein